MYRNTKNNLIYFRFPKNFIPKQVEDKYGVLLKEHQSPFKTVQEFLNSLVINMNFPSITLSSVTQEHKRTPRNFRPGLDTHRAIEKEFTIELRLTEGYLSYFMLYETLFYWNENKEFIDKYLPNFVFKTLDLRGYEMATIEYKEVLFNNISELSLSFSELDPNFNNFTISFIANIIEINPLKHLDKQK